MREDNESFTLTVPVTADQWAFAQRRLRYLEAVIVQILRDAALLKEWYTASELAELALNGMPRTRQGVGRLATAQRWPRRITTGRGGERFEYHCAALPGRAFNDMVARILHLPPDAADPAPAVPAPALPPAEPTAVALPGNAAPAWVLPLMRLVRGKPVIEMDAVLRELPGVLPAGVPCPSADELGAVLEGLGMLATR